MNNYFLFKNNSKLHFYKQIRGVSMGTSCGPSVANLYLASFELKNRSMIKTSLFFRFIDDIFGTTRVKLTQEYFQKIYGDLKITFETANKVNFLDLYISINKDNRLDFNLYIKPTNTFSYLSTTSNHPTHIFKNIPYSLLMRARKICSSDQDYLFHATKIHNNLIKRGYKSNFIIFLINKFYYDFKRNDLIPYKTKNNNKLTDIIPFITYFDRHLPNIQFYVNQILQKNLELGDKFNYKTLYKVFPNLSFYLLNQIKIPFNSKRFIKCNFNCNQCKYANTDFNLFNKFNIPISIPIFILIMQFIQLHLFY
jgi:hypothetical protein